MLISLFFSTTVYELSKAQIGEGFQRQALMYEQRPTLDSDYTAPSFERIQNDINQRLILKLIYTNLVILVLGGAGSYFLARRTLSPIEQALDAQSRFAADASHELRTPLTAMQTEIEVALRDKKLSASDARELLTSNLEEVGKLKSLANGLLMLARQSDGDNVSFSVIALPEVVTASIKRCHKIIESTGAHISQDVPEVLVCGDKDSLIEVFVNLIENAIKYSDKPATVDISAKLHGSRVEIFVKDQGQGIKASDLPYIFNRFYRADSSRSKSNSNGYGLGLSIVQQIVKLHQGSVTASSTPGRGSTFTIQLPIAN